MCDFWLVHITGLLRAKPPPRDHTSWDPHTKQLCYFRQIPSSRRTEVCISALKWSYHRGCRPTRRSDSFSPLRRRLLLLATDRRDSHTAPRFFSSHQTAKEPFRLLIYGYNALFIEFIWNLIPLICSWTQHQSRNPQSTRFCSSVLHL